MGILESKIKTIKLHKKSFKLTFLVRCWKHLSRIKPTMYRKYNVRVSKSKTS